METGTKREIMTTVIVPRLFFYASLSASRGNAYADMFGTNLDYTRTASTVENLPIKEESIVWTSEPVLNADGTVDKDSADYTVAGIADGINGLVNCIKSEEEKCLDTQLSYLQECFRELD